MSGPLGFGGGGGGDGNILPAVSGGTGISVSGSGTTSLTVSATGVNSVTAGTGISVSGTTALTVSATGVQSLTAGTGISVSGTTTPTVTNSGVTSIVAGTNVTVSGATGAVTVNSPAYGTTITASTIGGTASAGSSATIAREDHKHAFPAGAAPSALAITSTQSTGSSTAPALADHVHAMPGFGTPVNIDASLTSLSTGSLTTVARADHVHTVSKVPVLIASTTLTSTASSITFSSIPATYSTLILYLTVKSSRSDFYDNMYIRFNNDTGSNYNDQIQGTSATSLGGFPINAATNFMSNTFSHHIIDVPQYTSTAMHKLAVWTHNTNYNSSASAWSPAVGTGGFANVWKNTSAINRIDLFCYTGPFAVSSSVQLYGMP